MTYDGLSRLIAKKVEQQNAVTLIGTVVEYQGYLYDGWNCIMCVRLNNDATATTPPAVRGRLASCVWGPDIGSTPYARQSWQKAGGVGGLLCVVGILSDNSDTYFPLSDRMGNITGYRRPATATSTVLNNDLATTGAMLDYDAFGKEFRSSGPAADIVPFHYSTKFTDAETGLNYYGYRYYDSVNGRWLGRDPIGEGAGGNLFGMVGNKIINEVDLLGLRDSLIDESVGAARAAAQQRAWESDKQVAKNCLKAQITACNNAASDDACCAPSPSKSKPDARNKVCRRLEQLLKELDSPTSCHQRAVVKAISAFCNEQTKYNPSPGAFTCNKFVSDKINGPKRYHGLGGPISASQWNEEQPTIPEADAVPGDIVSTTGHVGIYLGGGVYISASAGSSFFPEQGNGSIRVKPLPKDPHKFHRGCEDD